MFHNSTIFNTCRCLDKLFSWNNFHFIKHDRKTKIKYYFIALQWRSDVVPDVKRLLNNHYFYDCLIQNQL